MVDDNVDLRILPWHQPPFFFCHCTISWQWHVVPQNTPSKGTDRDWERTATTFHCPLSDAIPRCIHTACSFIWARVEIITEIGQEHVNINHSILHKSKAATCYGFTGIYFSPLTTFSVLVLLSKNYLDNFDNVFAI